MQPGRLPVRGQSERNMGLKKELREWEGLLWEPQLLGHYTPGQALSPGLILPVSRGMGLALTVQPQVVLTLQASCLVRVA